MTSPRWLGKDEKYIFSAAVSVKKKAGTLCLTSARLGWSSGPAPTPSLGIKLSELAKFAPSAASSPVTLLKVTSKSGEDIIFHFTGDNSKSDRVPRADPSAENLLALLPGAVQASTAPAESNERGKKRKRVTIEDAIEAMPASEADLLRSNPTLKQLFNDLVIEGPLSSEEFWKVRSSRKTENTAVDDAEVGRERGVPSTLADLDSSLRIVPESDSHVRVDVTPTLIHQIFLEFPGVELAYKRSVPSQYSPQEFWERFFKSKFYKSRKKTSTLLSPDGKEESKVPLDAMFAATEDERRAVDSRRLTRVNPTLNLAIDESGKEVAFPLPPPDDSTISARDYKRTARYQQQLELIRKVNRHASLLVEGLGTQDEITPPVSAMALSGAAASSKAAFRELVWHPETPDVFQESSHSGLTSLPAALPNSDREVTEGPGGLTLVKDAAAELKRLRRHFTSWKPSTEGLEWASSSSSLFPYDAKHEEVTEALRRRLVTAQELLSHFWSAWDRADRTTLDRLRIPLEEAHSHLRGLPEEAASQIFAALSISIGHLNKKR